MSFVSIGTIYAELTVVNRNFCYHPIAVSFDGLFGDFYEQHRPSP